MAVMILFLGAALAAHQAPSSVITPESVARMIDRYGARRTVMKLTSQTSNDTDLGKFDVVLDGVSSGDARWLALVDRIYPGTDAGAAESLPIAVAQALPKNAAGVLHFFARSSWLRKVCGYPMIEPTDKEMRAYFKATIPAVRAVSEPKLQRAKRVCLKGLMIAQKMP